jgi:hypothetical protein
MQSSPEDKSGVPASRYIGGVTFRPARASAPQTAPFGFLTALLTGLLLAGCDLLGGGSESVVSRPATLHPESDAFAKVASRTYLWKESLRRTDKADSLIADFSLQAARGTDTIVGGDTLTGIDIYPMTYDGPAPTAVIARLGFRPGKVRVDSLVVPDPGSDLRFPETPVVGWRLDTTLGGLRFVRALRGVETVSLPGARYECWTFAESTWRAGDLLGVGTTWMGREGLVRHRSEWTGLALSSGPSGSLYREITAP